MKKQLEIQTDQLSLFWYRRNHKIRSSRRLHANSTAESQMTHSEQSALVAMLVAKRQTTPVLDMRFDYAFALPPEPFREPD